MFHLDETIRNIDSDSEDGESPRQKNSQPKDASPPATYLTEKPKKHYPCVPSRENPVFKRMLWILLGTTVFLVVCFISAPVLKRKFVAPKMSNEPLVWWREATTTEKPEHLELPGGHYIFSKRTWEGVEETLGTPLPHPTPVVVISNSDGDSCYDFAKCASVVRSMQEWHMQHNFSDIGFNFLIGGDRNVYEGRGWDVQSYHKGAEGVLGICFLGDYNIAKKELLDGQIEAANELLKYGVKLGKLAEDYIIIAQNQIKDTTSPGGNVLKVISKFPRWDPTYLIK